MIAYHIRNIVLFTLIYLALTVNWELLNIILGVLVAIFVSILIRRPLKPMSPSHIPKSIWATIRYIGTLIWDLILSGIKLAIILLSPKMPLNTGIINIPSNCQSELGAALSAHAITLTPNELVVEMDEDHNMYTHVLDAARAPEYVHDAQKQRLELLDEIFN